MNRPSALRHRNSLRSEGRRPRRPASILNVSAGTNPQTARTTTSNPTIRIRTRVPTVSDRGHRSRPQGRLTLFPARYVFSANMVGYDDLAITALGAMSLSMATFGNRSSMFRVGWLLTAPATGIGSALGAGPGWIYSPGALPPYHYGRWAYIGSRWGGALAHLRSC